MIGSVIDKYEVLQKLGEGATATVYRGRHLSIGKDVAIKVLHPHLTASSRYRERFNREARAVGRLSHENIVSILDYSGQNTEECYIVTELVDGCTLLQLIEEAGRIPSEIVAALGAELAGALAFAHRAGIIHRDIKPENVMVRRDGVVKLMDFGVARVIDEGQITLDGSLLGSPAYMSPQQALDEKLDGRSDLFSLGTVLFHATTGAVPFSGTNASIILRNIIDAVRPDVLELEPRAAPALAAVIDKLLQTRPEDRYPDADEVRTALLGVLTESGLAIDHPKVNLHAWLLNPKEVEAALEAHLRADLLARGKARLAADDTVGALQLFNRLLAIDEDHAEVLALIQSLHAAPTRTAPRGLLGAGATAAIVLAGLAAWAWYPRTAAAPAPPPSADVAEPAAPERPPMKASAPVTPPADEPAPRPAAESSGTAAVKLPLRTLTPPPADGLTAPPAADPAEPAGVKLRWKHQAVSVDVKLDGRMVGVYRKGATAVWVGTEKNPLLMPAGTHTLELVNAAAEPWSTTFTVQAGESRTIEVEMTGRPADYIVNARMPDDCELTLGGTRYGKLSAFGREFNRPDDPNATAVFDCDKGRFEYPFPPAVAGQQMILPVVLPPELTQ